MGKIKEKELKEAFIAWIDKKIQNKSIATEVGTVYKNRMRIVDVLVTNGHTYAFELKSEADNLKRLEDQISHFSNFYDYIYVVYWRDKFTIDFLNEKIGLIEAFKKGNRIEFKIIKKARINRNLDLSELLSRLWSKELRLFFKRAGIVSNNEKILQKLDRKEIEKILLKTCTKTQIVKTFRFFMKQRYLSCYKKYIETGDISVFTKFKIEYEYTDKLSPSNLP
ncbi:sce7726 family protein [Nitrosophilus kaiyonis]|uniref:sce7726 family protein n=1 Tax=Nitrosophilus kaiyonis TaxID=2930200 RepID=UPI002490D0F9|nr:sce7726 family protein [Nitrosophilus kaiyonis]